MALPLIGAAASVFAGPVGGVLSSVLGGVMGGGGAGDIAGSLLQGPANMFKGIGGAFKKLFGRKRKRHSHRCPARPQPFKPPFANPQAQLKTIQDQLGKINDLLSQLSGKLDQMAKQQAEAAQAQQAQVQAQPPAAAPAPSTTAALAPETTAAPEGQAPPTQPAAVVEAAASAVAAVVEAVMPEGYAKIDWMFGEAKKLMLDELQENQLKGQVMYTNASSMFSMISEFGSARSTLTYNMIY